MSFNLYAINRGRILRNCETARRCKLALCLKRYQKELADLHLTYSYGR